jgi:DNA-binding MarR family transcriptional regulator
MKTETQNDAQATDTIQVLRRFRVVFNAVRNHFQKIENQVGLGGAQVWALSLVRDHPGIGMGGIAQSMDIHQSTASNLIKTLLRKKLISMMKVPEDRRSVQLHILPAGLAILNQVPGPFEGVLPQALKKLPPQNLQNLDQNLNKLIGLIKADEQAGKISLPEL